MRMIVAIRHTGCNPNNGESPLILAMASRHYNFAMVDKPSFPSDAADKFVVRLPPGMRERIAEHAKSANRSMNAEVVSILQQHFSKLDDDAEDRANGVEAEERVTAGYGLKGPHDRAAVLKVLQWREMSLLIARVNRLGGPETVLELPPAAITKLIEGPRIEGTDEERKSYYSRIVKDMPIQALLTTEEIESLAKRVVHLHDAQDALVREHRAEPTRRKPKP